MKNKIYDIEYVIDDTNKQETGLTEQEVEKREEELKSEGATCIRVVLR